jgi:hypothetical protein
VSWLYNNVVLSDYYFLRTIDSANYY